MAKPFLEANADLAEQTMRDLADRYRNGDISLQAFERGMRSELHDSVVAAYRFAKGSALDDANVGAVNKLLTSQHDYLAGFVKDLRAAGDNDPTDWAVSRAAMYAGATTEAGARGTISGSDDEEQLVWVTVGDAGTCDPCDALDGETMSAAEWDASGMLPGGSVCDGLTNCRCSLETA